MKTLWVMITTYIWTLGSSYYATEDYFKAQTCLVTSQTNDWRKILWMYNQAAWQTDNSDTFSFLLRWIDGKHNGTSIYQHVFHFMWILNKCLYGQMSVVWYHYINSDVPGQADSDEEEAFSLCVSIFTANLWLLGDTVSTVCAISGELGCWWDKRGECLLGWVTTGCRELDGDRTSPAFLLACRAVEDGECLAVALDPLGVRCCRRGLVMWCLLSTSCQIKQQMPLQITTLKNKRIQLMVCASQLLLIQTHTVHTFSWPFSKLM